MSNQDELRTHTKDFLTELNLPVTKFVKNTGIGRTTYYRWMSNDFDFGTIRAAQLDSYLRRYGF